MAERARNRGWALALALLAACAGSQPPLPAPVEERVPTIADRFITTFWCGPPLEYFDDQRAAEIRAAGFNLIGASCEGKVNPHLNLRALRTAHRHGLGLLIKDNRTSVARPLRDGWQQRASRAIERYRDQPGLAGFFLVDEPTAERYPDIAAMRKRIRREAPGVIGYVNLLPDYVFLGPADYREHVEDYLFRTRPDLLSYDHYPFLAKRDRPSYFANLETIRELALEYDVPFLAIIQLMPHADYRDVTYAELSWQAMHALAFGARGISYFAYWTPSRVPDNLSYRFRTGIIEGGLPTKHYAHVARLNPLLHALAEQTSGFTSTAVWDAANRFGDRSLPQPLAWAQGPLTIGFFERDREARAIVVNQDYRKPATARLGLAPGVSASSFDVESEQWAPLGKTTTIPPGGAMLLRFE